MSDLEQGKDTALELTLEQDFAFEIVRVVEIGMNKFLKKSIIYSPFRLFYNIFSKSNPKTINAVRKHVAFDIHHLFGTIKDFNLDVFIDGYDILPKGENLLISCEEIAAEIFEEKLTPMKAFKLISDARFRSEVYEYFLSLVVQKIEDFT